MLTTAAPKTKPDSSAKMGRVKQLLQPTRTPPNQQPPSLPRKRKLSRTMSSTSNLGSLHNSQGFDDENGYVDENAIDLRHGENDVRYPDLPCPQGNVTYPCLPAGASQDLPTSSAISWSSSPPQPPRRSIRDSVPQPSPEITVLPKKQRKVPWTENTGNLTPAPGKRHPYSPYTWNKSASELKARQKEVKRSNKTQAETTFTDGVKAAQAADPLLPKIFLSDEQKNILNLVVNQGKSIFFTGSAGTGKSVLMRAIIAGLKNKYRASPDSVAVTASTGLAACNIDGMTLHSFAGAGLAKEPAPELVKKIKKNPKTRGRWHRTKVLVIDEVSMVDGDLFDKLEQIGRSLRSSGLPFGGIQLVITGDFFQLPPVPERGQTAKFAFEAETWNTCLEHTILLTHVFRQKDAKFASMLNDMRLGVLSPATIKAFQALARPLHFDDDLEATNLFPMRHEVEMANRNKMAKLSGETYTFKAEDSGKMDAVPLEKLLNMSIAPKELQLKKGAQVMLIKNINTSLVNGSLGKVVGFSDNLMFDYRVAHEKEYDEAYSDNAFDPALAKELRDKIHAAVYRNGATPRGTLYPVVAFQATDGTTQQIIVQREEWRHELPNGEVQARRMQIPLILSWAISIHKAQGQTLERVTVDLGKAFEKGQAYVALSRATTQEGLRVLNFHPKKVMVHPKVREFYKRLVGVDQLAKHDKDRTNAPVPEQKKPAVPTKPAPAMVSAPKPKSMPPPASKLPVTRPEPEEDEFGDFDEDTAAEVERLMQQYA